MHRSEDAAKLGTFQSFQTTSIWSSSQTAAGRNVDLGGRPGAETRSVMGPHTIAGWISFAAVITSSTVTGAAGMKLLIDLNKGRLGDRRDTVTATVFGLLALTAALLFMFAEDRP